jgi:hypothetical protein
MITDEYSSEEEFVLEKVEDFARKAIIAPYFQDTKDLMKCGGLTMAKTIVQQIEKAREEYREKVREEEKMCINCLACLQRNEHGERNHHPCVGCDASFGVASDMRCTMNTCPKVCDKFNAIPDSMKDEKEKTEVKESEL